MKCDGLKIWPVYDAAGAIDYWDWEELEVEAGDCEECCTEPIAIPNGSSFPTLTCPDGCHLHLRGDPSAGETVEAWCCRDEGGA